MKNPKTTEGGNQSHSNPQPTQTDSPENDKQQRRAPTQTSAEERAKENRENQAKQVKQS